MIKRLQGNSSNSLSEEEKSKRKMQRKAEREVLSLKLLEDVAAGVGWSSDKTLARYFSVTRQRIWVWAKEAKLPAPYKVGDATTRWKNEEVLKAEMTNFLGGF